METKMTQSKIKVKMEKIQVGVISNQQGFEKLKENSLYRPGGYVAGCEGSRCEEAYENYLESLEN